MLEFRSLTRTFPGGIRALDELTFTVPSGTVFGFLGSNGAGKTTAMRAVFGLTKLDSGEVRWRGEPVDMQIRRGFGYMPEERGLYPDMEIVGQVSFVGQLHGMSATAADTAAREWIEQLGLGDRIGDNVEELSLGNQQRVQLATSLVHDPELLVLDEPFSGLDPDGIDAMSGVLRDWAAGGRTVLFSSHQLDLVEHICDAVAIIDKGRLLVEGSVEELRSSGPKRYRVAVAGDADAAWTSGIDGIAQLESVDRGVATLQLSDGSDGQQLLRSAQAAGDVEQFNRAHRRLSEVFRDSRARA